MANAPKATSPASPKDSENNGKAASPLIRFQVESVSAAVFAEQVTTSDGKSIDMFNVSLRRSYRDSSGEWKHTHTLRTGDLLPAAFALQKAFGFIWSRQEHRETSAD